MAASSVHGAPGATSRLRRLPTLSLGRYRVALARLLLAASVLALWEGGVRLGAIDRFFFSSPVAIAAMLQKQFATGAIYKHLTATVQESLWGLALGFAGGALLAWLVTSSKTIAAVVEPVLLLLNAVPRIVLAPIFALWLGIGIGSKIAVSFFLVFVVIFFAVSSGIREVDHSLVERITVLGGSTRDLLLQVYIPSVLAWVFSSLRVAVGFAFTGAIVGEFVGSSRGLGYLLNFAQGSQNAALMMAMVTIIMTIIAVLFAVIEQIERRVMAWK